MLFSILEPSSLPVVMAQPANRTASVLGTWSYLTDTEHTTSGLNKEEE